MKMSMKVLNLSLMSAFSIALMGCGGGGGSGNAAQPGAVAPVYPTTPGGIYPSNQPYNCNGNQIQLRNSLGRSQCYPTTDLAQACAQSRGVMVQGGLCRSERMIPGRVKSRLRNRNGYYPTSIPLQVSLYAGESLKVLGRIDDNDDCTRWDAQLLQNGMVVGSATSDSGSTSNRDNLEIIAMGTNYQNYGTQYGTQYNGQYPQTQQYPSQYNGQCGAGYVMTNNQCIPNGQPGVGYNQGTYGQPGYGYIAPEMPVSQMYSLEILFQGSLRVELRGAGVSCQDGRGNSYPCQ